MPEFLVELYFSRTDPARVGVEARRACRVAEELTARGTAVRLVRSIFVPEDETCLFLFEADSIDAVREAVHAAGLSIEHVAETAPSPVLTLEEY